MKIFDKKMRDAEKQCSLCTAKFEIWLNNSRMNDNMKESVEKHFFQYCPACRRADEK